MGRRISNSVGLDGFLVKSRFVKLESLELDGFPVELDGFLVGLDGFLVKVSIPVETMSLELFGASELSG
jgi:hypothetical protein